MYLFLCPSPHLQIEILDIKHKGEHTLFANKQTRKAQFLPLVPSSIQISKYSDLGDPKIDWD